jgi:hypothetical protein
VKEPIPERKVDEHPYQSQRGTWKNYPYLPRREKWMNIPTFPREKCAVPILGTEGYSGIMVPPSNIELYHL